MTMYRRHKRLLLRKFTSIIRLKALKREQVLRKEDEQIQKQFARPVYEIPCLDYTPEGRQERRKYRAMYRELPGYLFMDKKEKRLYFKRKVKQYFRKLQQSPRQPALKPTQARKRVSFNEEYDVRPFCKEESVDTISRTASFKDTYSFDHFCA